MNQQLSLGDLVPEGEVLEKGWSLKAREKSGALPEPVYNKLWKLVLTSKYYAGKESSQRVVWRWQSIKEKDDSRRRSKGSQNKIPTRWKHVAKTFAGFLSYLSNHNTILCQVKSQFAAMTRAMKADGGLDEADYEAVEERRLLQYPAEVIAGNVEANNVW